MIERFFEGTNVYGQNGVDLAFWGVSQKLVKTSTWRQCHQMLAGKARKKAPKKGKMCQIDPILPKFCPLWGPQTPFKLGKKRENAKSTLFCPPTGDQFRDGEISQTDI